MHKNRPFMLLLLVLLSLDLLVFFSGLTTSDGTESRIEEGAEEVVDFFSEAEERCEEEENEVFGFGLPSQQLVVACSFQSSERMFFTPDSLACSVAIGWQMPLLI
ncbi:hypothetical protein P4B35_02655 [Pontiellaceae bacterium B12227]|nr:hypothetical protein [Pontiellaceae bacterium B12227]